jgi:hypothetical protein
MGNRNAGDARSPAVETDGISERLPPKRQSPLRGPARRFHSGGRCDKILTKIQGGIGREIMVGNHDD